MGYSGKYNAKRVRNSNKEIKPIELKKKYNLSDFTKIPIKERKEIFLEAYDRSRGLISVTALMLGMGYDAMQKFIKKNPDLEEQMAVIEDKNLDYAESKLWELIDDGNITAILYYLKCKGKKRGYIEKEKTDIETAIENGNTVDIHFKIGGGNIKLDDIDDAKIIE